MDGYRDSLFTQKVNGEVTEVRRKVLFVWLSAVRDPPLVLSHRRQPRSANETLDVGILRFHRHQRVSRQSRSTMTERRGRSPGSRFPPSNHNHCLTPTHMTSQTANGHNPHASAPLLLRSLCSSSTTPQNCSSNSGRG